MDGKRQVFPLAWILFLLVVSVPRLNSQPFSSDGNITFQPNVIPDLTITDRPVDKPESFRFEWLGNKFDIELFFNATYKNNTRLFSLRDFEDDFNVTVNYVVNRNDSSVQFGWVIDNVENVSGYVHNAWLKIEDTQPFDYDEIELDTFEVPDEDYNITRFNLPDNLVLSFEDLEHKGFIVGHQNKTSTSVKGFSNKTSWNLDPITFSSPIITVIGGTEGSTLDLKDIWDADQANGWNVFHSHRSNHTQFQSDARIAFGNGTVDGTTWFADTGKQLSFIDAIVSADLQPLLDVTNEANLRFGTLSDATDKVSENGVAVFSFETTYEPYILQVRSGGTAWFYSCFFSSPDRRHIISIPSGSTTTIYNSVFNRIWIGGYGTIDFYDLTMSGDAWLYGLQITGTADRVLLHDFKWALRITGGASATFNNIVGRENTYTAYVRVITVDSYLVNPDFDSWAFDYSLTSTGEIYRQYTFDLTMYFTNGSQTENANVTISNDYLGTSDSWLTFANGSILTQTYSYGHYNQTGGDTLYDYNPYNLTVTLDGYDTYTDLINITKPEDLRIVLTEASATENLEMYFLLGAVLAVGVFGTLIFVKKKGKSEEEQVLD